MQCTSVLIVTIKPRWWVMPYINTCAWFAAVHGVMPDAEKIANNCIRWGGFKVIPHGK